MKWTCVHLSRLSSLVFCSVSWPMRTIVRSVCVACSKFNCLKKWTQERRKRPASSSNRQPSPPRAELLFSSRHLPTWHHDRGSATRNDPTSASLVRQNLPTCCPKPHSSSCRRLLPSSSGTYSPPTRRSPHAHRIARSSPAGPLSSLSTLFSFLSLAHPFTPLCASWCPWFFVL